MALALPTSLSPSKVSSFKDCALAFRYSAIDHLPEPPSVPATKGSLVHRALELLFVEAAPARTVETALDCLERATVEFRSDPDFVDLGLDAAAQAAFLADAEQMVHRYFTLEDPTAIHPIGIELKLQASIGNLTLRGIIDRLELDADGGLVVTDYKTGKVPSVAQEGARLGGVHFYAYLCQRVFGVRPAKVQLIYLGQSPDVIVATPTEQSINGLEKKVGAIWTAVERACQQEDFRPKPSALCNWCSFRAYCPAQGGDPSAIPSAHGAAAVAVAVSS